MAATELLPTGTAAELEIAIERACSRLRDGEPVALPAETVYGLAADALNPLACARIFEAKERPLTDPLIVHLPDESWLDRVAVASPLARKLADAFLPGPLTMVLPRREIVPDLVTAGQGTVAVRISAHPVFRAVVLALDNPLAAPSANRFGRISPTEARHVVAELGGRIPLVLEGGPSVHGIESTIVRILERGVEILRQGPITAERLGELTEVLTAGPSGIVTPGSLKSHYAPRTPLDIGAIPAETSARAGCGLLAWEPVADVAGFEAVETLSSRGDLREVAANLYAAMKRLDERGLQRILALPVPEDGLGVAIMERLGKAATRA